MRSLLLLLALSPFALFASDEVPDMSAYRNLKIDYSVYEKAALSREKDEKILLSTALNSAQLFSEKGKFSRAPSWKSLEDLQERFEHIRDDRFLGHPQSPRRIPWMYPHDGCYARAAMVNRLAFRMYIPIPRKVFAFGNLRVKTKNAKAGVVGWWYHVAPIVEVQGSKYVLDPSIEPKHPLPLKDWLSRMGNPNKIKVSICETGTYTPGDSCTKETDGMELRAERAEETFLKREQESLKKMGRNHARELGDVPPWKN